jgi:hypothetical protein
VAERFRITKAQALALTEPGPNGEPPVYNKADVQRALQFAKSREQREDVDYRFRWVTEQENAVPERTGLLIGIEYWGEVPWKPKDRARNRVITILEGVHVRSHINPFLDGNKPYKEFVMNPINGRFWGLGVAEVNRFLQDSADNLLMSSNDAVNLAINVPLLVGHAFAGDPNQLKRRMPFDVIRCANPDAVKEVPSDFNAMQMAATTLMQRKADMQQSAGSLDPQQLQTSDRPVATQISEITRLASQRLELQIQIMEKDDFPWLGRTLLSRPARPSSSAWTTLTPRPTCAS